MFCSLLVQIEKKSAIKIFKQGTFFCLSFPKVLSPLLSAGTKTRSDRDNI